MDIIQVCKGENITKVKEALENGADPTIDDNYALRWACLYGYSELVELLLQDGRADPTVHGNISIMWACENGHIDVVKLLLEDGRADPTVTYNYPIRKASEQGNIHVITLLLQDGRVEVTDRAIINARTQKIKEMLINYRYRVDGPEYCKMKNNLAS
jgi:ankyrin repeat protein